MTGLCAGAMEGEGQRLFNYILPGKLPDNHSTVWSNAPLQPFAAGSLTPFSYSVLAEVVSRAWFAYYDRIGFTPASRPRLLRRYQGRAYLNLSSFAQIEAEQAGVMPLTLQVNGAALPLAAWEKPGFLAGFKLGRAQKKLNESLAGLTAQMAQVTEQAQRWHAKTREVRWSQAEVLQVMEEIERAGQESMIAYLAARRQLTALYAKLLALSAGDQADLWLLRINSTLTGMTGLVESEMANALARVSEQLQQAGDAVAWLKAGDYQSWPQAFSHQAAGEALADFLARYGHRTPGEGEMARARWYEEPSMLMRRLLACIEHPPRRPEKAPADSVQNVLDALPPAARAEGRQVLQQICDLHSLQSRALDALAHVWAGTRSWALAAAHEAMTDHRLHSADEVFFFELEEIKQMMTGEWNVSAQDEIRQRLAQRQAEHAAHPKLAPAELLIDDQEAQPAHTGLPGVAGQASGPLCRVTAADKNDCPPGILGAEVLDSGWAVTLPLADGFVSALGSPLDPFVAAACTWHRPVVVGLGERYQSLDDGILTTVDADNATVSQ